MAPTLTRSTKRTATKTRKPARLVTPKPPKPPVFVSCQAKARDTMHGPYREHTSSFVFKFLGGDTQFRKYCARDLGVMIDDMRSVEASLDGWRRLSPLTNFEVHQELPGWVIIVCVVDLAGKSRGLYRDLC